MPTPNSTQISLFLSTLLHTNLEFFSVTSGRKKMDVISEAVHFYISESFGQLIDLPRGLEKERTTLTLAGPVATELDAFLETTRRTKSEVITCALAHYLQQKGIDAWEDKTARVRTVLFTPAPALA